MSYITLNQIIDALAELDNEQKQLLLNLLQESEMPAEQTTSNKLIGQNLPKVGLERNEETLCDEGDLSYQKRQCVS